MLNLFSFFLAFCSNFSKHSSAKPPSSVHYHNQKGCDLAVEAPSDFADAHKNRIGKSNGKHTFCLARCVRRQIFLPFHLFASLILTLPFAKLQLLLLLKLLLSKLVWFLVITRTNKQLTKRADLIWRPQQNFA